MLKLSLIALFVSASAFAAEKTYQVTGSVTDVNDKTVIVDKGGEKFEITKDAGSTVHGDLQKGSKVTVKYKMTATDIEVKDAGGKKK